MSRFPFEIDQVLKRQTALLVFLRAAMQKLHDLKAACASGANVMPPLIEAVKAYATVGEISDVMREVFETYQEPAVF